MGGLITTAIGLLPCAASLTAVSCAQTRLLWKMVFYVLVQLHTADDVILEKAMLQLQCLLGRTTADPAEISGGKVMSPEK